MRYLSSLLFFFLLVSCRSLDPATQSNATQHYTTLRNAVDTLFIHDSIFVREYVAGDTVFRDRVQYRDRWRTHIVHDTIIKTDSIVQVIDHPPRKYIPPFYKHCTTILFIILAAGIIYLVFRWRLRL